jgi:exodeoxyribonuclease VII large subunit
LTVHFRQTETSVIIFGNTYPLRDQIKAFGGRFNGSEKNWRLPLSPEILEWVNIVCGQHGGGRLDVAGEVAPSAPAPISIANNNTGLPEHPDTLSIGQLMDQIHRTLASSFADRIWISGEIQNTSDKKSGFFLDLAEGDSKGHANATVTIKAIIWRDSLQLMEQRHGKDKISEVLQDGMKVRVRCQVQFYKERGQVSLIILDIDPSYTKGALALAREQLLKDLRAKGLADANKKLKLTPFPFHLGLISADKSRAHSDFIDQLSSLHFPGSITFLPTPMQGEAVPAAVVKSLQALIKAECDVIVMTRGGGSAADLRWFDAPEIAYAIACSPIPVVCAIGHHDDVCVAEEISYRREKTPTAAADFIVAWFTNTREQIDRLAATMARNLEQRLDLLTATTAGLIEKLHSSAVIAIQNRGQWLTRSSHSIDQNTGRHLYSAAEACTNLLKKINSATDQTFFTLELNIQKLLGLFGQKDPTPWLKKGWTRFQKNGTPILSVKQLKTGDELSTRLADGRIVVTLKKIEITNETILESNT